METPKGSLGENGPTLLDISLKIILQDVGLRSKLSARKYKPLMAINDVIEADWATYIFEGMLESIKKAQTIIGVPQYGILISYILEKKIPLVTKENTLFTQTIFHQRIQEDGRRLTTCQEIQRGYQTQF